MSIELDHNGTYVQRRKLYPQVSFNVMASKVELDWIPDDPVSHQLTHKQKKIIKQQQQIKNSYTKIIEDRIKERYHANAHRIVIKKQEAPQNTVKDTLAKELAFFNQHKIKPTNNTNSTINPELLQSLQQPFAYQPTITQNQIRNREQAQGINPKPQRSLSNSRYHSYDSRIINAPKSNVILQNYSSINPKGSFSPYPQPNSFREIQQIYSGYCPQQRPFRNVKPDNLQNYLREKTKSDRKRSILVSLNLFKH